MKAVQYKKLVLLTLFTALFLVTSTAWSYDYYTSSSNENVSRETFSDGLVRGSIPIPAHKARFCSSLLKLKNSPHSAFSPADDQRKVGKVAALSMILGARFALAPSNQNSDVRKDDYVASYPAQMIAAYRQCRKDNSLRIASSKIIK